MQDLEHISLKVDHQVNRHMSILENNKEKMAIQIQEARQLRDQLEDTLKKMQPLMENASLEEADSPKENPLKKDKKKLPEFHFGNSPFVDSSYEDNPPPTDAL